MSSYWYSTNGLCRSRLNHSHLTVLDQAYEQHARIQIYDDELFGQNVVAIANPYQGTMTAGNLHFGLYRQPPIWRMSEMTLDTLIFMDTEALNKQETTQSSNTDEHSKNTRYNKLIRNNEKEDDSCLCCIIS